MGYEEYFTRANILSGYLPHSKLSLEAYRHWCHSPDLILLVDSSYLDPWAAILKRYPD